MNHQMPIRVTTGELSGPGRPTEDRIVQIPEADAIIVLDGVSTLGEETPRGGWYAQTLGDAVAAALRRNPHVDDLRRPLRDAISAVVTAHGLVPGASPAATVAIVRWRREAHMVDALVLCDTPVVARRWDREPEVLADDRLDLLVTAHPDYGRFVDQLRGGCGFAAPEHKEIVQKLRDHQMRHINRPGDPDAYWVAEATPQAADHAVLRSWPQHKISQLLVMTDGVSIGAESYGLWPGWNEVFIACEEQGVQRVTEAIHRFEEDADPLGVHHPRYKKQDDKAAVLISFGAEK